MAQPGRSFRPAMALLVFVALALSGALFTVTVAGEPRVGVLYGRVLDRSGAPVDGAFVTVPGVGEDNYQEVRTDAEGRWRAGQVPIGYHNITAVRRGFASGCRLPISFWKISGPIWISPPTTLPARQ